VTFVRSWRPLCFHLSPQPAYSIGSG
jgi:hypothetical protein